MIKTLVCIGLGYSAKAVARLALAHGWRVQGTTRSAEKSDRLAADGIAPILFDGENPSSDLVAALADADALLVSAAPNADGDPFLRLHGNDLATSPTRWIGYLSTIGVYGDSGGAWIDETAACMPTSKRGQWRVKAENDWIDQARTLGRRLDILRLAGIYGPGRNSFRKLRAGKSRAIVKPGQVFNRIHVDDIAMATWMALNTPGNPIRTFSVCDDEPAKPQDVIWYAADLAGLPRPAGQDFDSAEMTPMARSFYSDCKRVRNDMLKRELGMSLKFPTYREGLGALWAAGEADI